MAGSKKPKEIIENIELEITSPAMFKKRQYIFRIFLVIAIIIFAFLSILAKFIPYFPIDLQITRWIQSFHPVWFDFFMKFLSYIGNPIPATILVIVISGTLVLSKRYKEGGMVLFSSIGMTLMSFIAKRLVGRIRPSPFLVHQFYPLAQYDSFPSGHVLFYVAFFGLLLFLNFSLVKKGTTRTIITTVLSLLLGCIGISRMYLGAHWFSDVIGAYLLGCIWLSVVVFLYRRFQR